MARKLELNGGHNYQGVISAIVLHHNCAYFGQFSDFSESSAIITPWSSQAKKNIEVYDRYELKSLRMVVKHNP